MSQTAVAQQLGVSKDIIHRAIATFRQDSTDLALQLAKSSALRAMKRQARIATSGKRDQDAINAARTVLTVSGVLSPDTASQQVNVAVVIGLTASDANPSPARGESHTARTIPSALLPSPQQVSE